MSFLLVTFSGIYFSSCHKDALDCSTPTSTNVEVQNPIDRELKNKVFQTFSTLDLDFQRLIENLKKQDSLKNFITKAWVQKNGLPVWDKTLTNKVAHISSFKEDDNDMNVYFTPLKSTSTGIIQSYIVSYQKGELQYHRLYNVADLGNNIPSNDTVRQQLKHLFAPFAYFENHVNGKTSLSVGQPYNFNFDNVSIVFNSSSKDKLSTRSIKCIDVQVIYHIAFVEGDNHTELMCWDAPSTGSSSSSGGGWSASGVGSFSSSGGTTSWSGSSIAAFNISDLISVLIGEVPLQQLLSLYPNDAAFINFVVSLKNSGQIITHDYAERLYASYDKYTQAGFSSAEVATICKDNAFFQQVNAFLDTNGFTNENRLAVKGFTFLIGVDDDFKALNQNRGNKSIKQLLNEFGYPKIGAGTLIYLAREQGLDVNQNPQNFPRIGRVMEDFVLRSLGLPKNNTPFLDPTGRGRSSVIPDGLGNGNVAQYQIDQNGVRRINSWIGNNSIFFDSKFVAKGEKLIKDNVSTNANNTPREQLSTMIDVLGNMRGGVVNSVNNPQLKPSDHGIASLYLITLFDVEIDPNLINQAINNNVNVYKRWIEFDPETYQVVVSGSYEDKTPFISTRKQPGSSAPLLAPTPTAIDWSIK